MQMLKSGDVLYLQNYYTNICQPNRRWMVDRWQVNNSSIKYYNYIEFMYEYSNQLFLTN